MSSLKKTQKLWGYEDLVVNNEDYCAKFLNIKANYQCSLHYHLKKRETFFVMQGVVRLEQRDVRGVPIVEFLVAGEQRTIEPKTPHRFSSLNAATILEISTTHSDEDVVRIEDSRRMDGVN